MSVYVIGGSVGRYTRAVRRKLVSDSYNMQIVQYTGNDKTVIFSCSVRTGVLLP